MLILWYSPFTKAAEGMGALIKIAVCDDIPAVCDDVRGMVMRHPQSGAFSVTVFYTCEDLCAFLQKQHAFDLLLLDIEFPGMNGLGMSDFLRNTLRDYLTQIVYISAKDGYDRQLFEYQPLNFLKKPIDEKRLHTCIDRAMAWTKENGQALCFTQNKSFYRIPLREILYLESINRQIAIHTEKETIQFYGKIDKLELSGDFIRIHQSYLINLFAVRTLRFTQAVMRDGAVLPISRAYRQAVRSVCIKDKR